MKATNMMSVMPKAVHKTTQQPAEQNISTDETKQFSDQLKQMMLQTKEQTKEQKTEPETAALETELEKLTELEQEEVQDDSEAEEVQLAAAALFQPPFVEAETELKLLGQAEGISEKEAAAIAAQELMDVQAETAAEKTVAPNTTQAVASSFAKEGQPQVNQMETAHEGFEAKGTVEEVTRKLTGTEEQAKPIVQPTEAAQSSFEAVQSNTAAKAVSTQTMEPLVNGAEMEFQYSVEQDTLPVVETKTIEMSDLDIQSEFRMKVSLPKLEGAKVEIPAIQQPVSPAEQAITVTLVDKNPAVNQQQLAQSVSDIVMQQVETTQNGQTTTARLSLKPEALGQVTIELKMEDNQLKTVIIVESTEAKEMLDKGMQQLTTSLAQKNIQLNETTIQLNQPQESNFAFAESSSHQEQQQENSQSIVQSDRQEEISSQPAEEETDTTTGRVSILA